jgi:hypothetical protein
MRVTAFDLRFVLALGILLVSALIAPDPASAARLGPQYTGWSRAGVICCTDLSPINYSIADPAGNLYLRRGNGQIERRDRLGQLLATFSAAPADSGRAMRIGPDGKLYVANTGSISVMDTAGQLLETLPIDTAVFGILSDGVIVKAAYPLGVQVLSRAGVVLAQWEAQPYNPIQSGSVLYDIAILPGDRVGAAVNSPFRLGERISVYDRTGVLIQERYIGTFNHDPGSVTPSTDGLVAAATCDGGSNLHATNVILLTDDLVEFQRLYDLVYLCDGATRVIPGYGGDFYITQSGSHVVLRERAGFIATGPLTGTAAPRPRIIAVTRRPSTTIVDIDYQIVDEDSPNAAVAAFALEDGVVSLDKLHRLSTLIDGTSANVGAAISTNAPHRLSWDAAADLGTVADFKNVQFQIQANDGRGLLELDLLTIPANMPNSGDPALVISRSPFNDSDFIEAWMWLVASADAGVSLDATGTLRGTTGSYAGVILAQGATTTGAGRGFLFDRLGVVEASAPQIARAREGNTPGTVVQYDARNHVGVRPARVNGIGFDSYSYPSGAYWVVVP